MGEVLNRSILLIESKKTDGRKFGAKLIKKGFEVYEAMTSKQAIDILNSYPIDLIVVNAISFDTNGARLCASVDDNNHRKVPLVLLVKEPIKITTRADLVLSDPITPQKLINRFSVYFPKEQAEIIEAGPICLDVSNRLVTCREKTTRLTPKLLAILKMLMEHKDDVLDRNELFSIVWDTDYLGDTRTLDVHISWLRNAIEEDPSDPKIIETVRGVGFQLTIDQNA